VLESWLLFQQGKWKEGCRISQAAEAFSCETDDYVTLVTFNLSTDAWRAAKAASIKLLNFSRALFVNYGSAIPSIRIFARSLANMALAKRGIALQLRKESIATPSCGGKRRQPMQSLA